MSTERGRVKLGVDIGPQEPITFLRAELPTLDEVSRYYALAEDAGVYSDGPCLERLAIRLAAYAGAAACVPVVNGTLALQLALMDAAPKRPGGLVATASFAPIVAACAIRAAGLRPLFVDIDPVTWQLDPDALALALEQHGGAVAAVLGGSAFGSAAPAVTREQWRAHADAHGVPLVIDSTDAFGAVDDRGRRAGGGPETEVFSFGTGRPFAIGEGGAILTSDPERAGAIARMANLGIDPATGVAVGPGTNGRMSELTAATGLAMLDRYEDVLGRRSGTAAQLRAVLSDYGLRFQGANEGSTWPVLQLLAPDTGSRATALRVAGQLRIEIQARFDPPLHRQPAFADAVCAGALAVTDELASRALTLPMANGLGPRQILRLAELLDEVFKTP